MRAAALLALLLLLPGAAPNPRAAYVEAQAEAARAAERARALAAELDRIDRAGRSRPA